jgi:hypothetical protein
MSNAISRTLDFIFDGADEIIGSHAPYEIAAERQFVADARKVIEEALSRLHKPVLDSLNKKLAAMAKVRDAMIECEEAIWNEKT